MVSRLFRNVTVAGVGGWSASETGACRDRGTSFFFTVAGDGLGVWAAEAGGAERLQAAKAQVAAKTRHGRWMADAMLNPANATSGVDAGNLR